MENQISAILYIGIRESLEMVDEQLRLGISKPYECEREIEIG